jgi:hypothetical protein
VSLKAGGTSRRALRASRGTSDASLSEGGASLRSRGGLPRTGGAPRRTGTASQGAGSASRGTGGASLRLRKASRGMGSASLRARSIILGPRSDARRVRRRALGLRGASVVRLHRIASIASGIRTNTSACSRKTRGSGRSSQPIAASVSGCSRDSDNIPTNGERRPPHSERCATRTEARLR